MTHRQTERKRDKVGVRVHSLGSFPRLFVQRVLLVVAQDLKHQRLCLDVVDERLGHRHSELKHANNISCYLKVGYQLLHTKAVVVDFSLWWWSFPCGGGVFLEFSLWWWTFPFGGRLFLVLVDLSLWWLLFLFLLHIAEFSTHNIFSPKIIPLIHCPLKLGW